MAIEYGVLFVAEGDPTEGVACRSIRAAGMLCTSLDTGLKVLKLGHHSWDCIVLDTTLPDMTGLDLLLRLRNKRVRAPILILSGDARIETKVEYLEYGADAYLTKPFHPDELCALIKALHRRATQYLPAQSAVA